MKFTDIKELLAIDDSYLIDLGYCVDDIYDDEDYIIDSDEEGEFEPVIEFDEERITKKQKLKSVEIKPIIEEKDCYEEPPHENLLAPPFSMLFVAKPGSGKSTTLLNLLRWYAGYFDQIFIISPTIGVDSSWVYAIENDMIPGLNQANIMTSFNEDNFKEIFKQIKKKNRGVKEYSKKLKTLFVFDDIVGELPRKQRTTINTFARNHRHYGISHITLSQEYRAIPPKLRKNCFGVCLYASDNELERKAIIDELGGRIGKHRFTRIFDDCASKPFGFLFMKPFEKKTENKFCDKFEKAIDVFKYSNERIKDAALERRVEPENKQKGKKPLKEEDVMDLDDEEEDLDDEEETELDLELLLKMINRM